MESVFEVLVAEMDVVRVLSVDDSPVAVVDLPVDIADATVDLSIVLVVRLTSVEV